MPTVLLRDRCHAEDLDIRRHVTKEVLLQQDFSCGEAKRGRWTVANLVKMIANCAKLNRDSFEKILLRRSFWEENGARTQRNFFAEPTLSPLDFTSRQEEFQSTSINPDIETMDALHPNLVLSPSKAHKCLFSKMRGTWVYILCCYLTWSFVATSTRLCLFRCYGDFCHRIAR